MTPLAPQKKVLISQAFLNTEHGEMECVDCHGGNPAERTKSKAHKGLDANPSYNNPEQACGECHADIVATSPQSLHTTLSTFAGSIRARANPDAWQQLDTVREAHCAECHVSCGGCHVSRPGYAQKGFVDGHLFNKRPDILNQCMACHGSRIGNEFIGIRGQGDVHAAKYNMGCIACHKDGELHAAAGPELKSRYHLSEKIQCTDCHIDLAYGSVRDHTIHIGKVQCQVCHSQSYTNCYSCHVGTDEEGLPYRINERDVETFKIGLNHDRSAPGADYRFMLVRHVPADPRAYDHYIRNAQTLFDSLPTWKRTSPHNIQRQTWQNANCNNCHGNRELFLSTDDLLDYEHEANLQVVVSDRQVPGKIARTQPLAIDMQSVNMEMVQGVDWLHQHLQDDDLVLVDTRDPSAYAGGHIPSAVNLDPITELRWPWDSDKPQELLSHDQLARIFGQHGIAEKSHVVVYDADGWRAGFLVSVLTYAGAQKVTFLQGGITAWIDKNYALATETRQPAPKAFNGKARPEFLVDNAYVQNNLDNPLAVIVDARTLDQSKGITKHPRASRAGRVPGSVKLPVASFYKDHANLRTPEEMLLLLKSRGVTPDKKVIVTCNTGAWAGGTFFIFKYLGYPDVRMHDASWISWCESYGQLNF